MSEIYIENIGQVPNFFIFCNEDRELINNFLTNDSFVLRENQELRHRIVAENITIRNLPNHKHEISFDIHITNYDFDHQYDNLVRGQFYDMNPVETSEYLLHNRMGLCRRILYVMEGDFESIPFETLSNLRPRYYASTNQINDPNYRNANDEFAWRDDRYDSIFPLHFYRLNRNHR